MSTTFSNPNDPTGSIAACYAIFGSEEAREISARVPPKPVTKSDVVNRRDDDEPESDIYIA